MDARTRSTHENTHTHTRARPPPEPVTMEQTVTEKKRQGECPEKERAFMVVREERKKIKYN